MGERDAWGREARPARCPGCGTPSVEPGDKVVGQGHGLHGRRRWGPPAPDAAAEVGSTMQPIYVSREELRAVEVLGKVVGVYRRLH